MPERKEMTVNEIEQMFKKMPNLSWLDLTGGEISLREDLVDVVKTILTHSKNLRIFHMTTNGMIPDRIIAATEEAIRMKFNPIISVSIDGPKIIHDQLRGHKGSYEQAINTFKALRSLKSGRIYISCTISSFNYKYLDEFIAELKADIPGFTIDRLHFNVYHSSEHYYNNEKLGEDGMQKVEFEHIQKYLQMSTHGNIVKKFLNGNFIHYFEKYFYGEVIPFICQAMHGSVFVDAYGVVFPCLFYNRPIGKLHETDYDMNKLLQNPELGQLKTKIENKKCPTCWAPCEAYSTILGNLKHFIPGIRNNILQK